jgi:hypothetical protein
MCQGTRNKNHNLFKIKLVQSYTRDVRGSGNNRKCEFRRAIKKILGNVIDENYSRIRKNSALFLVCPLT